MHISIWGKKNTDNINTYFKCTIKVVNPFHPQV